MESSHKSSIQKKFIDQDPKIFDMSRGVRRAYNLTILFLMEVIKELGTSRSLELLEQSVEKQADIIEKELRNSLSSELEPLEMGLNIYLQFMRDAGAEVEVYNRDKSSITCRVGRCPFYEALLDVGIDCGYFLSGLCTTLTIPAIQAILSRFDPRLRLETVMTRQSAEDLCLERIYLEK